MGEKIIPDIEPLLADSNPYVQARAIWLLAALGPKGLEKVENILIKNTSKNEKNSYDLARNTYKVDSYRNNPSTETPFNNQVNLMNY